MTEDFVMTFSDIYGSDFKKVGFPAVELANIHRINKSIPLGFVLNNDFFVDFLESNNILPRVKKLNESSDNIGLSSQIEEIKTLILKGEFSDDVKNIVEEAYDSISIDDTKSADSLIHTSERPYINIFLSFDYKLSFSKNKDSNLILNIKGKNQLFRALKDLIIQVFSLENIKFRRRMNIKEFNLGFVFQKMILPECSGFAVSFNPFNDDSSKIFIASQFGIGGLIPSECKFDEFVMDRNSLHIFSEKINLKEFILVRNEDGLLEKKSLREGTKSSLNEKLVFQIARIARSSSEEKHIVLFWYLVKDQIIIQRIIPIIKSSSEGVPLTSLIDDSNAEGSTSTKIDDLKTKEEEILMKTKSEFDKELEKEASRDDYDVDLNLGTEDDDVCLEEDLKVLDELDSQFGFEDVALGSKDRNDSFNTEKKPAEKNSTIEKSEDEYQETVKNQLLKEPGFEAKNDLFAFNKLNSPFESLDKSLSPIEKVVNKDWGGEDSIFSSLKHNEDDSGVADVETIEDNSNHDLDSDLQRATDIVFSSLIPLYNFVYKKLRDNYKNLFGFSPKNEDFVFLLDSINEQQTINNLESLKKLRDYKDMYLRGEKITLLQLKPIFEAVLKFI